jgi:hypothetical protein
MQSTTETLVTGVLVINDTERTAVVGLLAKNKDDVYNIPTSVEDCQKNENKLLSIHILDEKVKDRKISISEKEVLAEIAKGKYKDGDRVCLNIIIDKRLTLKTIK